MRNKIIFTKQEQDYIFDNYLKISSNKIGDKLGYRGAIVRKFMKENHLIVSVDLSKKFRSDALNGRTSFTDNETQFVKDNYLVIPVKRIAKKLGKRGCAVNIRLRQLGLVIPKNLIEKRKRESQFNKGQVAFNKGMKQTEFMSKASISKTIATRFKKGNVPHNTNYNGHERITKDGYIEIRIDKCEYRLKHLFEWEKLNGKLPKGYCLRSLDGDKLNTAPENWKLITRSKNMEMNSIHRYPPVLKKSILLIKKIDKFYEQSGK